MQGAPGCIHTALTREQGVQLASPAQPAGQALPSINPQLQKGRGCQHVCSTGCPCQRPVAQTMGTAVGATRGQRQALAWCCGVSQTACTCGTAVAFRAHKQGPCQGVRMSVPAAWSCKAQGLQHVTAATCVVLVRVRLGGRGRLCRPSQLLGGRTQPWLEWWRWHPRAAPLGGDTHGQWQRGVTHQTWWGGLALSAVGSPFSGDAMCLDMGQQRRYSLFRVVQFVEQPGAWLHRTPSHVPVGHCGDPHRAMTQTVIPPNLGGDMP